MFCRIIFKMVVKKWKIPMFEKSKELFFNEASLSLNVHFKIIDNVIDEIQVELSKQPGLHCTVTSLTNIPESLDQSIHQWLDDYVNKRPASISLPLNWDKLPPFTQSVLLTVQRIPFGKTLSYSDVAKSLGHPRASRAVGGACGRNSFLLVVPCHRVLAADRSVHGFSASLPLKQHLFDFEN